MRARVFDPAAGPASHRYPSRSWSALLELDPFDDVPPTITAEQARLAMRILENRLLSWCVGVAGGSIRSLPHERELAAEALALAVADNPDLAISVRLAMAMLTQLRVMRRGLQPSPATVGAATNDTGE